MRIGIFDATVTFDAGIAMYRGEIELPNAGADFYASTLEELENQGHVSLNVLLEFANERGIQLSGRTIN